MAVPWAAFRQLPSAKTPVSLVFPRNGVPSPASNVGTVDLAEHSEPAQLGVDIANVSFTTVWIDQHTVFLGANEVVLPHSQS